MFKMAKMKLHAVLYKSENMYVVKCVELPVVSQGETLEKALENIKEAVELYLQEEDLTDDFEAVEKPIIREFEVEKVEA